MNLWLEGRAKSFKAAFIVRVQCSPCATSVYTHSIRGVANELRNDVFQLQVTVVDEILFKNVFFLSMLSKNDC